MNAKRYNIATLADMAAIPESARGRFLAELPSILSELAKWQDISRLIEADWRDDAECKIRARFVTGGKFFHEVVIKTGGAA